jgi:hypothetical protein
MAPPRPRRLSLEDLEGPATAPQRRLSLSDLEGEPAAAAPARRLSLADLEPQAPVEERALSEPAVFDEVLKESDRAAKWLAANPKDAIIQQFERAAGVSEGGRAAAGIQVEGAETKLKSIYEHAGKTVATLRSQADAMAAAGDSARAQTARERAALLEQSLNDNMEGALTPDSLIRGGRAVVGATSKVLDWTHKNLVRRPTSQMLDPSRPDDAEPMEMKEWQDALNKSENPLIQGGLGLATVAGMPFGATGAALGTGAGLLLDSAEMVRDLAPKQIGGKDMAWADAKKPDFAGAWNIARESAPEMSRELGVSMATDPLTYVGLAGGSATKNAVRGVTNVARAAGKTAAEADALAKQALATLEKIPGTAISADGRMQAATAQVFADLKAAGVPDELLVRQFGETGSRFAKGGVALEVPFTEKRLELGDVLSGAGGTVGRGLQQAGKTAGAPSVARLGTNVERLGRAAGAAVDAPLARAGTALGWVDPVKDAVKARQLQAVGRRDQKTQQNDREGFELMEAARDAGLGDRAQMADVLRRTLDPDFDLKALDDLDPLTGQQAVAPAGARIIPRGDPANPEMWAAVPTPGHVPLNQRPQGVQDFAEKYRAFNDRRWGEIQASGADIGRSENLLSGEYVPRQYDRVFGHMDELNLGAGGLGGGNAMRARNGVLGEGLPLGAQRVIPQSFVPAMMARAKGTLAGDLVGELDFAKIIPTYNRQQARTVAKAEMVRDLAQSGLARRLDDPQIAQQGHLYRALDSEVAIPEKYAKLIDEVFADRPMNVASILRANGVGSGPGGRAVLAVADWASKLENHWKGLTLNWRPGYHAMNIVNDTQYLMALGAREPVSWLLNARGALPRGNGGGKLISIGETGAKKTADELLKEAQNFGWGNGAIGRNEAVGQGARATEKAMGRVLDGKAPRGTLDEALDAPGALADGWTDTSRVAAYMLRRSLGDTPEVAANAVRIGMVDYQTASPVLRVLRFLMPFATFALRGPQAAAYHAVRKPRAVVGSMRAAEALTGDQKEGVEPRSYWSERGSTYPLSENQQGFISRWREMFGGTPIPEEDQARVLSRDAFTDPFQLPVQTAAGNLRPAVNSLSPFWRAGIEGALGRDLLTDNEMKVGAAPLNAGVPAWAGAAAGGVAGLLATRSLGGMAGGAALGGGLAAGDWAEADSSQAQQGWLSRYFGTFLPPPAAAALNARVQGGVPELGLEGSGALMSSPSPLSAFRRYDARGTVPQDTQALQGWSMLTGAPVFTSSPLDALWNTTNSAETQALLQDMKNAQERWRRIQLLQAQGR